jgi:RNA polymerase sigma-70 factor (subfamily 1)
MEARRGLFAEGDSGLRIDPSTEVNEDERPPPSKDAFWLAVESARNGSSSALGTLFNECRMYLLLVANQRLGESIQAKVAASDLVQETFLQAQQVFGRFYGTDREELLAWLKRILEFKLAQTTRTFVATEMRAVKLELPIQVVGRELETDRRRPHEPSPDSAIQTSEIRERLRKALDRLRADYRLAIELRNLQQQSFAELGKALNRSAAAARMVWVRAVAQLEVELRSDSDSSAESKDQ